MAVDIFRGAAGATSEETVAADVTVDGEEVAGAGAEEYVIMGGIVIPVPGAPVTDPSSPHYPVEETVAAGSATEDTSTNVA